MKQAIGAGVGIEAICRKAEARSLMSTSSKCQMLLADSLSFKSVLIAQPG